jgi:hypothetical protein
MGSRGSSGKVVLFINYVIKLGISPVALAKFKKFKVEVNASQNCKYIINKKCLNTMKSQHGHCFTF